MKSFFRVTAWGRNWHAETLTRFEAHVTKIPHMAQGNKKRPAKVGKMTSRKLRSFYEVAERIGVSYWTLWRGAEAGFFKTVNIGSRRMIPETLPFDPAL